MPSTVKLGSKGADVSRLQGNLNTLGTSPQLVVDGDFGKKTDEAVRRFQANNHLLVDGICGPATWSAIDKALAAQSSPMPGFQFYDRRKYAAQAHGPEHQWPVFDRPIEQVTGVCLHQTACLLGESISRYDSVGAHFAVTRMGKIIWLHDFDRQVAAANGWNDGTVSIEIDGLYAGVKGDPSTVWDDPSTPARETEMALTPETVRAVKALVRWIKGEIEKLSGRKVNALVAHRQASDSRRNDPGSAIWGDIAIPLHIELAMSDGGIGFKLDDGYPIPFEWDPRCVGYKY